jgi:hypothetical protein
VRSAAVHPGEVLTDVVRSLPGPIQRAYRLLLTTILLTPQQGELGSRTSFASAQKHAFRGAGRWRGWGPHGERHPCTCPTCCGVLPAMEQVRGATCTAPPAPTWTAPRCAAAATSTQTVRPSSPASEAYRMRGPGCTLPCWLCSRACLALPVRHRRAPQPAPLLVLVAGRRRMLSWQPGSGSGARRLLA